MLVGHLETAAERGVWPRRPTSQCWAATPSRAAFVRPATMSSTAAMRLTIFIMSTSTRAIAVAVARPTLRPATRQYHMLLNTNCLPTTPTSSPYSRTSLHTCPQDHNDNNTLHNVYILQTLLHALAKANGMMKSNCERQSRSVGSKKCSMRGAAGDQLVSWRDKNMIRICLATKNCDLLLQRTTVATGEPPLLG